MKYFGLAIAKNGYAEINKAQFESTFNVWQKNAMIFLNEFAENKQARKSTSAQLKLLTSEKQLINEKGKPQYTIEMKAYIVLAGNDSANTYGMLDIEDCDRRFMYISGGKNLNAKRHNIMDPKLFELQKEDFINYLLTYDYDLDLANTVFTNEAKLNDIEAAKQYEGARIHAWMFSMNAPGDSVAYEHPEWFETKPEKTAPPELVWVGNRENVKMAVMELLVGLYLAKVLYLPIGEPAGLADVVRWGERWFGVDLSNYSSLKRNIFMRKKMVTVFLEQLKKVLEEEAERVNR